MLRQRRLLRSPLVAMDTRSATQDPTLYLLHSALLLAVGSDREYHGSSSIPLPKLGAAQSRKFLQGVLDQTTDGEEASQSRNKRRRLAGVRAHPSTRRSLWPDANGEKASSSIAATPTPIRTALDHLPAYWRQHNALCEGCGGIVLPGVTATYARKKKRRAREGQEARQDGGATCLVCRQEAAEQHQSGSRRRDRYAPVSWLAEDVEAMQRSKGRFASVRRRKGTKGQLTTPQPPPMSSRPPKPAKAASTAATSGAASKAPPSAASASPAAQEKAPRKVVEVKPSSPAGPSRPAPSSAAAAVPTSPPQPTKKSALPPAAAAPTTKPKAKAQPSERKSRPHPPTVDSTNSSAKRDKLASTTDVDQEKQRKHDHKAALRAMLSGAGGGGGGSGSGSRKKKDKGGEGGGGKQGKGSGGTGGSGAAGSSGGGGGGGGLADFLAGL